MRLIGEAVVATVYFNFVAPGYFATLRTPLLAGRDFDRRDTKNHMALGADRASILRLVTDVAIIVAGGVAAGLAFALASVTPLQGMLFGLEPRDPVTMAAAVCLLSAMAMLAGYLPARRATRMDPMTALRSE